MEKTMSSSDLKGLMATSFSFVQHGQSSDVGFVSDNYKTCKI